MRTLKQRRPGGLPSEGAPFRRHRRCAGGRILISIGTHCLLELFDCPPERLDDPPGIEAAIRRAAQDAGALLLHYCAQHFTPQGVTAVALLAESHISVHTWPDQGYAAADVFTCGATCQPRIACDVLVEALGAGRFQLRTVARGPGAEGGEVEGG